MEVRGHSAGMMFEESHPAGRTPRALLPRPRRNRVALLALLFVAELVGLALAYQFLAQIECQATDAQGTCEFLKRLVARALVMLAVGAILIRARPMAFSAFLEAANRRGGRLALLAHLAGVGLLLLPLGLAWGADLGAMFGQALLPWLAGAVLAAGGGLLWLARAAAWRQLLLRDGRAVLPILAFAFLIPDLADIARPLWDWQVLAGATFTAVAGLLRLVTPEVQADPQAYVLGVEPFFVHIARQCSGVEGFALVLAFVGIYAVIFRKDVRPVRLFLVLLPVGIALSWALNILRIAVLVLIGARISPEVAVNGFHSYAGWLFFTLLAFGLIWVAQRMRWLHRSDLPARAAPLRDDPTAAAILPFVVFMVAGTLVAALFHVPGLGAPVITVALAAALAVFLPVYRALDWRPDGLALLAGVVVGAVWVAFAPAPDLRLEAMVAGMPAGLFALWAGLRILGTTLMVPVVEEFFFRGYVQSRIQGTDAPRWRAVLALLVASLGFAALHGRWIEAGLAGLVFGLMMMRRGRVTDAVWAHVVANAIVAGAALWQREWSLI